MASVAVCRSVWRNCWWMPVDMPSLKLLCTVSNAIRCPRWSRWVVPVSPSKPITNGHNHMGEVRALGGREADHRVFNINRVPVGAQLRWRLAAARPSPSQSLHWLRWRACWQMLAPPHCTACVDVGALLADVAPRAPRPCTSCGVTHMHVGRCWPSTVFAAVVVSAVLALRRWRQLCSH